jgi:hypothetical protein
MVVYIPTCNTYTDDCGICGSTLREYSAPSPRKGEVMQYSKLVRGPSLGESPLSSVLDPMKVVTHADGNSLPPSDSCTAIRRQPLASENGGNGGRQLMVTKRTRRR